MTKIEYINMLQDICNSEFISAASLVRQLNISHNTLMKVRITPDSCSMQTMRKIKLFVDNWMAQNLSVTH